MQHTSRSKKDIIFHATNQAIDSLVHDKVLVLRDSFSFIFLHVSMRNYLFLDLADITTSSQQQHHNFITTTATTHEKNTQKHQK
jgi:hypothetical protein